MSVTINQSKVNYGPSTPSDGLVFYVDAKNANSYPGTGTIFYDLTENNIDGTMTTSTMWNSYGSMSIDTNDLQFGHNSILEPPDITISAWVNLNDRGDRHILITKWLGWSFEISSAGNPYLRLRDVSPGDQTSSEALTWGEWYYITGTFDDTANYGNVYVNGINRASGARTGSITYNQGNFNIPYLGGTYADGEVALVQIWNRALTGDEVLSCYESTKTRFGK